MPQLHPVFLPVARTTFHMPGAGEYYRQSVALLKELCPAVQAPVELLTSVEMLEQYLRSLTVQPDLVIFQNTTFVDAEFINAVMRLTACPVVLWAVREPVVDGGRLRLNSLTGAFAAGNRLVEHQRLLDFVFGAPLEKNVRSGLEQVLRVMSTWLELKHLNVGLVGSYPPGFAFGHLDESLLTHHLGARVIRIEVGSIIQRANDCTLEEVAAATRELAGCVTNIQEAGEDELERYARLKVAYDGFVRENNIKVLASRCWPDFFVQYGAPVCAVLSLLTERGVMAACEADLGGALTMFMQSSLTGRPAYLGDPVALEEEKNSIIYWHCGAGACSLARPDTGARLGVHPNRQIGPTMEFGLRPGTVTVARLGKTARGLRMYILSGQALDEPRKFLGTSVAVAPGGAAREIIARSIADGWEPHFALVYGDVRGELKMLCRLLGVEVWEY